MNLHPKSADQIDKALSGWRTSNYISGVMLGGFAGVLSGLLLLLPHFEPLIALVGPAALGGCVGLQITRRHWRKVIARYGDSFIRLDDSALEIRALVRGGIRQVRCRLSEIEEVAIGERRRISAIHPLVSALDSQALVIKDKKGASVAFEMIASLYSSEDLKALFSSLEARISLK